MSRRQGPKIWLTAVVATLVAALSYKIYHSLTRSQALELDGGTRRRNSMYTLKSIALTLLHSVLSLELPLEDILLNLENVTFILPPNLLMDDLACNIKNDTGTGDLPETLIRNYKLLKCSNIDGYFNVVKNLRPDMLLVCEDDLGISSAIPKDLGRFVKEIVTVDQNRDDVYHKLAPIFFR